MKKRIISMLLAGMMVLNSAVVYADDNADISVNEASEAENNADVAFTDGDTDEVEITEEMSVEDVLRQSLKYML